MERGHWNKELEEDENLRWTHTRNGKTISISRFEDGTWDTYHGGRLIENYDTRDEAVTRALEIMDRLVSTREDKNTGVGQT